MQGVLVGLILTAPSNGFPANGFSANGFSEHSCLELFRPVRRCKVVLCLRTDTQQEHHEHAVPEDVEEWWEQTAHAGRCTSYVWDSFAANKSAMPHELSRHIMFRDRDEFHTAVGQQDERYAWLRTLLTAPDTVCEPLVFQQPIDERPSLCWAPSGGDGGGRGAPAFFAMGNSHTAVWELARHRLRNIFTRPKDVKGATAYGLRNRNSSTGAHSKFRDLMLSVPTGFNAASNNVLIVQLGHVDVDSLLGLRRQRRRDITIAQQVNASVTNLVSFLAEYGARWRFARIVLVGITPPTLHFDKAWVGLERDPAFTTADPEIQLQLNKVATSPWHVRMEATRAFNAALEALAASDPHGIFAYFDINAHVGDTGLGGRLHREYSHLLMANNHIRDDRAFGLFITGLARAAGLEWCGKQVEQRCSSRDAAMRAAEFAARQLPVFVAATVDDSRPRQLFWELQRNTTMRQFVARCGSYLEAIGATVDRDSIAGLVEVAKGFFGSRWPPATEYELESYI